MRFLKKSLDEIGVYLKEEIFKDDYSNAFTFLPDELVSRARTSNLLVDRFTIPDWLKFEEWVIDFDGNDFKSIIFKDIDFNSDSSVIFISDESLRRKVGIEFLLKDYFDFVEYYEDEYQQGFFQPLDYIIILIQRKEIRILHHEGHVYIIRSISFN